MSRFVSDVRCRYDARRGARCGGFEGVDDGIELTSYDELRLESDPTRPGSAAFIRDLDDYALVVDEAHNLRNPSAQRFAAVSALLGGSRPKTLRGSRTA